MKTIGVDLWGGQARGAGLNHATCMRPARHGARRSFHDLFIAAYPRFADRCREVDEPGVAVIAVEETTGRATGLLRLRARIERHVASIIGRHDECDLFLNGNDELALRHLVVIVDPVQSYRANDASVRYRILDLRTSDGFVDESDRRLRGLRCEGPAILRCGGHALFVIPLGDPTDWPASAEDAWACLPERVYFDEVDRFPEGSLPRMQAQGTDVHSLPRPSGRGSETPYNEKRNLRHSVITRTSGPRDTGMGLIDSGDLAGTLELIGPSQRDTIRVGHDALRDGVLIGRYARCDGARGLADDTSLSRVHALLIEIDGSVLVIDTASRNGTSECDCPKARLITVARDTELKLGKHTRARWRWVG